MQLHCKTPEKCYISKKDELHMNDLSSNKEKKTAEKNQSPILSSGTWAGVTVALVVILVFILAATFLKSLVFGIILAYFFLPLEKFFEKRFFQYRPVKAVRGAFRSILEPVRKFRIRISGAKEPSPEERAYSERASLAMHASIATMITVFLGGLLILLIMAALLVPNAVRFGKNLNDWANSSEVMVRVEKKLSGWIEPGTSSKTISGNEDKGESAGKEAHPAAKDVRFHTIHEFVTWFRSAVRDYIQDNYKEAVSLAFTRGSGILSGFFSFVTSLGIFAFDLLLCIFFFFYFLHGMAFFMSGASLSEENESAGAWCVKGIFGSSWMPTVSESTRNEAIAIIDRIALMFNKWIRGYLLIIIIETVLYMILFSLFSVPYAPLLAMIAGSTILLPFLGVLSSSLLTVLVCISFCDANTTGTLLGVCLTYIMVNGILEQLFLYPTLVGGAIGLTMLETIIVVLLGGAFAGIPGMIFAVPTAAVIKYLIPKVYHVWEAGRRNAVRAEKKSVPPD